MSNCEGQYWSGMKLLLPSYTYILSENMTLYQKAYIGLLLHYVDCEYIQCDSYSTLQWGNWIQKYLCSGISPNWEMKSQVMLSECRISTLNFLEEEESQKRKNMELQCLKTNIFPCKQSRWLDLVNQAFIHLCQYQKFKIFCCLHKSQFVQFANQKFSRLEISSTNLSSLPNKSHWDGPIFPKNWK